MIVYLEITDCVVGGGFHLYGALAVLGCTDRVQLTYPMDGTDVARFNRLEPGRFRAYNVGFRTQRFQSHERLTKVAIQEWRQHFPAGQVLVEGYTGSVAAMPILDGLPETVTAELDAIRAEITDLGGYKHPRYREHNAKVEDANRRWFRALRAAGVSHPYYTD